VYEITVVHGAGKGKVMWSGPEIIVVIALGRKIAWKQQLKCETEKKLRK